MNSIENIRSRLIQLLRERSLKIGPVTLSSGIATNYYFDGKRTTLHCEGAYLSAKLILEEMRTRGIEAAAIGGLTLGADPIVAAVAAISYAERARYTPMDAFIVRSGDPAGDTQSTLEGFQGRGESAPVVIVDDIVATGRSAQLAIQRAEEYGSRVQAVFALIDREQGAADLFKKQLFIPLLTASELLDDPSIRVRLAELQNKT